MREVVALPVTEAGFAPFGAALNAAPARLEPWNGRPEAEAVVELLTALQIGGPAQHLLEVMERHPHSSQTFFPLTSTPYLIAVAPDATDGRPDTDGLCAFIVPAGTVIQYRPAVWHAPLTALGPEARFAMHVHKDGSAADCEFSDIPSVVIRLEVSRDRSGPSPRAGDTPPPPSLSSQGDFRDAHE